MSIYGSTFEAGTRFVADRKEGRVQYGHDEHTGDVLIRDGGGRNDYPDPAKFPNAVIGGAEIPAWCVPGHDEAGMDAGYAEPGEWYRLGIYSEAGAVEALLSEKAAKALAKDLRRWLRKPKTHPVQSVSTEGDQQ